MSADSGHEVGHDVLEALRVGAHDLDRRHVRAVDRVASLRAHGAGRPRHLSTYLPVRAWYSRGGSAMIGSPSSQRPCFLRPSPAHPLKKTAATAPRFAMDSCAMVNAAESSAFLSRVLLPSVYELPSRAMPTSCMTIGLPRRSAASMCASRYARTRANQPPPLRRPHLHGHKVDVLVGVLLLEVLSVHDPWRPVAVLVCFNDSDLLRAARVRALAANRHHVVGRQALDQGGGVLNPLEIRVS
eukprot:scaffold11516_cov63-Phaeocystis_antarctica.AAC.5